MEQIGETEEKLTATSETIAYMNQLSKFAYYESMEFKLSDESKLLLHEEVEKAVLLGIITPSDYFLLKVIADFSWANTEMVTREIARRQKQEPEKAYPKANMEITKSRLARLSRTSLVRGFEYETAEGKKIKVYCISESGLYLLRKKLYYDEPAETFNTLQPPEEAFRRLASNYVAQRMSYGVHNTKFIPGTWNFISGSGKVFLYSQLFYDVDGEQHVVLVEPYYIRSNERIVSRSDMQEWNHKRLNIVRNYKSKLDASVKFSLIYVIEDKFGLKAAVNMVANEYSDDYFNIFFTSENALFMKQERFANAFLKIEDMIDGVPSIKASSKLEFM